jgi:hypothetical protein
LLQRLVPFQESHGRIEGDQADNQEQRHLCKERCALHVIGRAFFEIHDTQAADDQDKTGSSAIDRIESQDFLRRDERQRLFQHQHFGRQNDHDCDETKMMKKSDESVHRKAP